MDIRAREKLRMMKADVKLVRSVYTEHIIDPHSKGEFIITAYLTRFGGLYVMVMKADLSEIVHHCDNIIDARNWIGIYDVD